MKKSKILICVILCISLKVNAQTLNLGLYFDPIQSGNKRVTVTHNAAYDLGTSDFTFEAWIRMNTVQAISLPALFSSIEQGNFNSGLKVYFTSSGKLILALGGALFIPGSPQIDLRDSICHHIAVARNGTTLYAYIDGSLYGTNTGANQNINSTANIFIGMDAFTGANGCFKGLIHEVRFWNISRTQSQIQAAKNMFLTGNETGLIGYWRMNDGSGQIVNDLSVVNNDGYLGIFNNADAFDPVYQVSECLPSQISNSGMRFDGSADLISVPHNTAYNIGTGAFTIEAEIECDTTTSILAQTILSNLLFGSNTTGVLLQLSQGHLQVGIGSTYFPYSSIDLRDNVCHHVAVVRSGITAQLFIDGINVATTSNIPAQNSITTTHGITIGDDSGTNWAKFKGLIREVRMWNVARSAVQIQAYKSAYLLGNETGLIGCWRLNDGSNQVIDDLSSINNDGVKGTTSAVESSDPVSATGCSISQCPLPIITASGATTFCQGGNVVLSVPNASGTAYQWKLNNTTIPGATLYSYTATQTGSYTVQAISTGCGTLVSAGISVSVNNVPAATITGSAFFCPGGSTILTAGSGTGYSYQWKLNGNNIGGATAQSYTANTAGAYSVMVTNSCGSATSSAVNVAQSAAPVIAAIGNTTICSGYVVLYVDSCTGCTYQWKWNGTNLNQQTHATYNASSSGSYTCVVTQGGCIQTSNAITVTRFTPAITASGATSFCNSTAQATLNAPAGTGYTYQWYSGGSAVSGATGSSYAPPANINTYYRCLVNNTICSAYSNSIYIYYFTAIPAVQHVSTNDGSTYLCPDNYTFHRYLYVPGGTGYSYQWKLNGTNVSGSNSSYYANVAGSYSCAVSNACGTRLSDTLVLHNVDTPTIISGNNPPGCMGAGYLTVKNPALPYTPTSGLTYRWNKDNVFLRLSNDRDCSQDNAGIYFCNVTYPGCSEYTTNTIEVAGPSNIFTVDDTVFCNTGTMLRASTGAGTGSTYQWKKDGTAITGATNSNHNATATGSYTCVITSLSCGTSTPSAIHVTGGIASAHILPANAGPDNYYEYYYNESFFYSCSAGYEIFYAYPSSASSYQWYKDLYYYSATGNFITASASGDYYCQIADSCGYTQSNIIHYRTLPSSPYNPTGITGPSSAVCSPATLSVYPEYYWYSYQWYKNGVPISNANYSEYDATESGWYNCYISAGYPWNGGCTDSCWYGLNVTILTTPVATITAAGPTTFCSPGSVVLNSNTGAGYTYQWYKSGYTVSGATTTSYTATQTGYYTVRITNTNGCTDVSNYINVTAASPPIAAITGLTTFCSGDSVMLSANTGTGLTYQWKNNGTNISGATKQTYSVKAAGSYTVVVTNICGPVTSSAVSVTVNPLPSATITPAGPATFCSGGSVVLNAPTGTNKIYQWKKGANLISGATLSSYTTTTGGNYRVIVTNTVTGCSKTTASATTVTVNALPAATITPQGPTTFCAGGSVVLQANTGTGLTYKWKKGSSYISGATLSNYTAAAGGNYRVQVTNINGCSKTSALVAVSVPCKEEEAISSINNFDFAVYPNPNSGEFTIKFSNKPTSPVQIELTDEIGKVVKKFETDDETFVIKESNLGKGIYCLALRSNDKVVIKKINVVK